MALRNHFSYVDDNGHIDEPEGLLHGDGAEKFRGGRGARLNLSPAMVSKHVMHLENRLGNGC
ncbi:hypothetical protein REMIM1_PF00172 (plasmid) [Rhizobium etli bv. mimosae str. Mim1]|nr:hypothetical protein REMIM1_PF00172 [Rhizobium etli bv. mimosae str. Mim1]